MHPAIGYDLNQAHLADLRHQAQRDALARAARAARRADRCGRPRGGQLVLTRGAAQTPVAALVAAALAVIVYRARSARRRATGSAA